MDGNVRPGEWPDSYYGKPVRGVCHFCGFLSKRLVSRTGTDYGTASLDERVAGSLYLVNGQKAVPWCLMETSSLRDEVLAIVGTDGDSPMETVYEATRAVTTKSDRACEDWFPFTPGRTPMQHLEDLRMMRLEEDRKEHAQKLAEMQLRAMETQAEIARSLAQVQKDHLSLVERSGTTDVKYQRRFFWIAIVGTILAAVSVLQVLGLAYPNGVGWLVEHAPGQPTPIHGAAATPQSTLRTSGETP